MRVRDFLLSNIYYFIVHLSVIIFTGLVLDVFGIDEFGILFVLFSYVLAIIINLTIEYIRKARFYNELSRSLESLDKKHMISSVLPNVNFVEGKILKETLIATDKSMNDEISMYKRDSAEYKEYIETWVHEIKTPIAAAKLIIENNKSETTMIIMDELNRIEGYIEQSLYYARSSSFEKDFLIKDYSLRELINPIIRKHSRFMIENKIKINVENVDFNICTDIKWLSYIVEQIIVNAMKYKDNDPYIDISAEELNDRILLKVTDNGIGIPKEELPRVFEKGFTGMTGRKYIKSTGMGLYLSNKLSKKLGIKIEIDSEVGQGTKVSLLIPKTKYSIIEPY